jgi:hypothetical protein
MKNARTSQKPRTIKKPRTTKKVAKARRPRHR